MGRMFLNCEVCGVAMSGFFARIRKLKGKKVRVCPNCRKAIDNRCLYEFEGEDDESGERGRVAVASGCNASRRGNLQGDTTPAKSRKERERK